FHILKFICNSVPVVQFGGWLVFMSTGWTLFQREPDQARESVQKKITTDDIAARAFYPLTLPLTVGPGSISVAITIGADQAPHESNLVRLSAAIIGPALVAVTVYVSYCLAERVG